LKIEVKLALVVTDSISENCPVGPRIERGVPLPMWKHYVENCGYYFQPEQLKEAQKCADLLNEYIEKHCKK
jgi:predicted solute-binding protein